MLKSITQSLMLFLITLGFAHAEETFEGGGTITKIDKAAQVIFIGNSRMMVDSNVIVTYGKKQGHLFNIAKEGMQVNISGIIESNGTQTITSAYIYPNSQ